MSDGPKLCPACGSAHVGCARCGSPQGQRPDPDRIDEALAHAAGALERLSALADRQWEAIGHLARLLLVQQVFIEALVGGRRP